MFVCIFSCIFLRGVGGGVGGICLLFSTFLFLIEMYLEFNAVRYPYHLSLCYYSITYPTYVIYFSNFKSQRFSFFASFYRCNISFFKYKFQIVTFLFFTPVVISCYFSIIFYTLSLNCNVFALRVIILRP